MTTRKTTLDWNDLFKVLIRDNGGRWYAEKDTPEAEYIDITGYRMPSRAYPHSHAKPLMTLKYAKWLRANHPDHARALGLYDV